MAINRFICPDRISPPGRTPKPHPVCLVYPETQQDAQVPPLLGLCSRPLGRPQSLLGWDKVCDRGSKEPQPAEDYLPAPSALGQSSHPHSVPLPCDLLP